MEAYQKKSKFHAFSSKRIFEYQPLKETLHTIQDLPYSPQNNLVTLLKSVKMK